MRNGTRPLGIMITGAAASAVFCAADGTVKKVGHMRGYGNYVIIEHSAHYHTVYANMGTIRVREGQRVDCGSAIGNTDGTTLHFQINQGHTSRDALALLPRRS
jgi:murein DD-endopeptidase MepM/ murein hydrolase activator NlpD